MERQVKVEHLPLHRAVLYVLPDEDVFGCGTHNPVTIVDLDVEVGIVVGAVQGGDAQKYLGVYLMDLIGLKRR
jgi:hypothetical protein